ncbi:hypothetical protein B0H34DRAFT_724939 [Crassisporium funariophilum]|nr:hypothetical protein B0H34DRAFT_724939 [Crassisporium funariophilum]
MKFSTALFTVVIAALSYSVQAMPSPSNVELVERGCSCKKIGDEWICSGTSCP